MNRLAQKTAQQAPAAKAAHDAHRDAIIAKAEAIIAAMAKQPETPHWGHVGSLEKVRADLDEVIRFLGA